MNSDCSRWFVSEGVAQQPSMVQWLPWKILLSIGKIFPPSGSFASHSGITKQIICAVASISMFFHGVKNGENALALSNHFKALIQTVCCLVQSLLRKEKAKNMTTILILLTLLSMLTMSSHCFVTLLRESETKWGNDLQNTDSLCNMDPRDASATKKD